MAAKVNGVTATTDQYNQLLGTSSADKISGTTGNETLSGLGGVDYLYGGAGNDTFAIRLSDFDSSVKIQDVIHDFSGAGGWNATNNDFLSLRGFGEGSTINFARYGTVNGVEDVTNQYYTISSTATGLDYTIFIHSLTGKMLSKATGDLNFYN